MSVSSIIPLDQHSILTGSSDGIVRALSIFPHRLMGTCGSLDFDEPIEQMSLSPDKKSIAFCSHDNIVRIYSTKVTPMGELPPPEHSSSFQFSIDSKSLQNSKDITEILDKDCLRQDPILISNPMQSLIPNSKKLSSNSDLQPQDFNASSFEQDIQSDINSSKNSLNSTHKEKRVLIVNETSTKKKKSKKVTRSLEKASKNATFFASLD